MEKEKSPAIRAEHLHYSIRGTEILHDISMQVDDGEFVGVIGPNGSGKSTLLKNIYKMLKPDSGHIFLEGERLDHMGNRRMARRMAVVTQENHADFDFTVHEVIEMGRYPVKKLTETLDETDETAVRRALDMVGLGSLEERSFLTLSGGEKQRVLIARAFAQETPLIVLDEPTNHLDIGSQIQILSILKRSGKTVLMALHDLSLAAKYCTRIYVMAGGRVAAEGQPFGLISGELVGKLYGLKADVFTHNGSLFIDYR